MGAYRIDDNRVGKNFGLDIERFFTPDNIFNNDKYCRTWLSGIRRDGDFLTRSRFHQG